MDLQLLPIFGPEISREEMQYLAGLVTASGQRALSVFLYEMPGLDGFLETLFDIAAEHNLDLDFHADETLDTTGICTRKIAEFAAKTEFSGKILIGHACALVTTPEEERRDVLDLLSKRDACFVSLPLCNAYLMGRNGRDPHLRGSAPVHAIRAAGIDVALASDNVRDGFYAYGDMDPFETFRFAVRFMHLDHPIRNWAQSITRVPARVMRLPDAGRLFVGGPADLVVFKARNWAEFVGSPQGDRIVIRDGKVINAVPPDPRQLDHLQGMMP